MNDLFGNEIKKQEPDYIEEKMNPFEAVELITRYKYLSTTDTETFYYVMRQTKGRYYTVSIHTSLEDAKRNTKPDFKIFEKKMDYNTLYMVIRIMTYHPALTIFANVADSLMYNVDNKSIFMMLEQEIPKNKYYIKFRGSKKKNDDILKRIYNIMEIGTKDAENCLDIVETQNKTKEFLKCFDTGD